jgi:hypothetical protein
LRTSVSGQWSAAIAHGRWGADIGGLKEAIATGRVEIWLLHLAICLVFMASIGITATLLARRAIQKDFAVRV